MSRNNRTTHLVVFAAALVAGIWTLTASVDSAWGKKPTDPGGGGPGGGGNDVPPEYHLVDLGFVGGPYHSQALDINDWSEVAGSAQFSEGPSSAYLLIPTDSDGDGEPDTWYADDDQDGANDLAIRLNGLDGVDSHAMSINENGQIAGFFLAEYYSAFVWQNGYLEELGSFETPGGSDYACINNLGQVVGGAFGSQYRSAFLILPEDTDGDGTGDRWFADDGFGGNALMILLGTLGGPISSAEMIADSGWIVGEADTANGERHAFLIAPEDTDGDGVPDLWNRDDDGDSANDLMADLGTLGGPDSYAAAVNELGQVVGYADVQGGTQRAFLVSPLDTDGDGAPDTWFRDNDADGINDLMEDLGTVSNKLKNSYASDINDLGQVVGRCRADAGANFVAPFIWENGVMRRLDSLTDNPEVELYPRRINNAGEISSDTGYILVPISQNP